MSRNNQGGVLADVTRGLLCSLLDDKATKASEIYVFTMCETVLHNGHELFDNGNNCDLSMPVVFAISLAISALVILYCFEFDTFLHCKITKKR